MWFSIIRKCNQEYFLGTFQKKKDARNMSLIAKTFSDMENFKEWYPNRREVYAWLLDKCNSVNISCEKIILAIYDGYYGELYNNIKELNTFIDDFKVGYEI